jgi:3-oxoacyl-[acyl-carrier-protein] synthase-3
VDSKLGLSSFQFYSYGIRLMEFGAEKIVEHYLSSPSFSGFDPEVVFGHAASDGMSEYVVERCGIPKEKFQFTHHLFANTISASVPMAMANALDKGVLREGLRVLILFASAGVTTALASFRFQSR